ncbi:TerC family protein [Chondromyces apiculatus]|uniref:Integral membrane protein TerC n=1 Tax=Chondromyces apiculatus DSM 436 TaxID=1192034 RepID=A0A017SW03_9BACT|nr:TerC family protein [Chondromyces apiculatus]EYF01158.1 Integral membrane protein TerC [Chondromyces apiculatus DSM 436]
MDFSPLLHADGWITLATLSALEIVLGIDNIVFLSIMVERLPEKQQPVARRVGLLLALGMRLLLLLTISWVMSLKATLFTLFGHGFSGRDLILLVGGLFLVGKATHEIFDKLEVSEEEHAQGGKERSSFTSVIIQIMLLDIVFSLDSVITAVGMAQAVSIMVIAMVLAVGVMLVFAGRIGAFINRHPSMKILALSFLILIGVVLIADGTGQHVSKGYVYFAMFFSLAVELINMRLKLRQRSPVKLHNKVPGGEHHAVVGEG